MGLSLNQEAIDSLECRGGLFMLMEVLGLGSRHDGHWEQVHDAVMHELPFR